tara:strand:- start:88 stop:324 length:237 start_codon:yes stop_codon:yes gene_type:complete
MNKTVFIDAQDGGIGVYIGAGNKVGFAKTPKMLAYILDTKKVFGEVMFTSSMDFATDYGFATDDGAKTFFNNAIEMRG